MTSITLYHSNSSLQFSEQRDSWSTPYKFNSKELDAETGLYYYGARYHAYRQTGYTPEIGIWLGVDPMSDKYPSLSPYAYCALNPVILVDPDGREIWIIGEAAQAGFDELTHSTRIGLKFVDGQVSLSNPNTNRDELDGEDQLLFDAITSTSVKAEIITTKDPSNDGGEYHGTIYDDIDQTATSTNEVNVRNMTDLEGKHKAPRGSGIKHEATEGYNMGLKSIELKRSIQSAWSKEGTKTFYDRSGNPYNVNYDAGRSPDYDLYDAGHKTATPAPNERKNN